MEAFVTIDRLLPWKIHPEEKQPSTAEDIISPLAERMIHHTEIMLDLNPGLGEADIFQVLTENIARFFAAEIAGIWLCENEWRHLASSPYQETLFSNSINAGLFDPAIAEEAVRIRQPLSIPDIWQEQRWRNKESFRELGLNGVLLVPISIPRFSSQDTDRRGVLQVFLKEQGKTFSLLETKAARLFSRLVGLALARKKITVLQKSSSIKDRIGEHIFRKLTRGEGIFMADLFNSVIPELGEIMDIQRCALFSVNRQRKEVILEAGYPEKGHGIGKTRSTEEPHIQRIIDPRGPFGQFEHEKIHPLYILITDPQRSALVPGDLRYFLETQNIHSVLYLPLKREEVVNYFLTFDAQGHHERFTEDEIEILVFLGKELMKGLRLERLQDLLHDSKNIAISQAYFARRIQKILEKEKYPENEKLNNAVEIVLEGSNRLQEVFLTLFGEGKEAVVDVAELAGRKFRFYRETMKEAKKDRIHFRQAESPSSLCIRCVPFHIERVLDNLLSNAVAAVPDEGGEISIRAWQHDLWAVMEIANTAQVSKEDLERHLRGEVEARKGRGLHICDQLIRNMGGKIEVEAREGLAIFQVKLPALNFSKTY